MSIANPVTGVVVRGTGTLTPVPARDVAGDAHILVTGVGIGSNILATPSGWALLSRDLNAKQIKAFGFDSVGSTTIPGILWSGSPVAWAVVITIPGGLGQPIASALDGLGGDRASNHVSNIIGPASAFNPTNPNELLIFFGERNKTSTSNSSAFTPPTGFTSLVSDVPSGTSPVAEIAYWVQTTATSVAANSAFSGSVADGTTQSNQGSIFALIASPTQPIAGDATATASASGNLNRLGGAATGAASASGSLLTAVRMAAAASSGSSLSAALTNWSTVTLGGTQYTGPGGLHDPALAAQGWNPPVGAVIYWDATNATCYTNGEISSITNNCSFVAQYFDGTTYQTAIIIITPQMVSTVTILAAAAGALTTAIQMASGAVALAGVAGQISTAIRLAGSATAIASAAASLTTGVQLNASASVASIATGQLQGGQASLQGNAQMLSTALGVLTAKIQLAGTIVATSVVAGAIATGVVLSGSTSALTNAAADLQVAIRLAGAANVSTTAAGTALIVSSLAAAANGVSSATGALLTAFQLSGNAFVSSSAQGDLSTGISLSGAAEVDTQSAITPVGAEGQFGRADINVLSPTGYPTALAVFLEGSSAIATISYFNSKGLPFVPSRVQWKVQDLSSGVILLPYADINPVELSNAVTILGSANTIVNQARDSEQHGILFRIVDNLNQVNYVRAIFELLAVDTGI